MDLATEATETSGNSLANQQKYLESYGGKIQQVKTQMDSFWLSLFDSDLTKGILDFFIELTKGFNSLAEATDPVIALGVAVAGLIQTISVVKSVKNGGGRYKLINIRDKLIRNVYLEKYASEVPIREEKKFEICV